MKNIKQFLLWLPIIVGLYLFASMASALTVREAQAKTVPIAAKTAKASKPAAKTASKVDLDKLAKAVALHETKDCGVSYGAARYNNCHGFRINDHFVHFKSKADSYAKFKKLWPTAYSGGMPTLRDATTYVCGGRTPTGKKCPGGNPNTWLASVNRIYNTL